jgi:hypothetical protein
MTVVARYTFRRDASPRRECHACSMPEEMVFSCSEYFSSTPAFCDYGVAGSENLFLL